MGMVVGAMVLALAAVSATAAMALLESLMPGAPGVVLAAITLVYAALVFVINRLTGGSNEVAE